MRTLPILLAIILSIFITIGCTTPKQTACPPQGGVDNGFEDVETIPDEPTDNTEESPIDNDVDSDCKPNCESECDTDCDPSDCESNSCEKPEEEPPVIEEPVFDETEYCEIDARYEEAILSYPEENSEVFKKVIYKYADLRAYHIREYNLNQQNRTLIIIANTCVIDELARFGNVEKRELLPE